MDIHDWTISKPSPSAGSVHFELIPTGRPPDGVSRWDVRHSIYRGEGRKFDVAIMTVATLPCWRSSRVHDKAAQRAVRRRSGWPSAVDAALGRHRSRSNS